MVDTRETFSLKRINLLPEHFNKNRCKNYSWFERVIRLCRPFRRVVQRLAQSWEVLLNWDAFIAAVIPLSLPGCCFFSVQLLVQEWFCTHACSNTACPNLLGMVCSSSECSVLSVFSFVFLPPAPFKQFVLFG